MNFIDDRDKYEKLDTVKKKPLIISNNFKAQINFQEHVDVKQNEINDILPPEFDWRKKIQSKIYNQEDCGNCWALSTISAINDHYQIKFGKNIEFSWKQAMNCYENNPCMGGNPAKFLKHLESSNLVENTCNNVKGCNCENLGYLKTITLKNTKLYRDIKTIKHHLTKQGPLIAGMLVYENFKSGKFGTHGIYLDNVLSYDDRLKPIFGHPEHFQGCHSIVVVGYGETPHVETSPSKYENVQYWICRNSWGEKWGENGYFKIATHKFNKLVQLEKEYDFKNGTFGGMLAFDITTVSQSKFFFPYSLPISVGIVSLLVVLVIFYQYKKSKIFYV
jgi:C1A family cysteine protease